ncbi:porin [Psychrobium sp. 1_MG-2023]|uniref:porin n=1 Tax=Psychrobium sp. 1_MG-2023 TaxID=3062624 RepID=UPI000C330411|nr:porin [Psychrobium sp. 1_MG-2023]MDP2561150.1 porin [Psychrobium sp. 1_MG-2023]PKF55125.1 porin [Alteromonadales bacterium alter-6D02]
MKLSNTLLASSLIMSASFTTQAASEKMIDDIRFYGKAEIQVNSTEHGLIKGIEGHEGLRYVEEGTSIHSPFSRVGIKGSHQLNDELTAVFKFEYQVKGMDSSTDTLSARNTYIGIKGRFGEVVFGRNDTRFKASEGKFDLFNENAADIAQVFAGQDRLGDSVTYTAPSWRNINFAVTAVPKHDAGSDDNGYAWLVSTGDKAMKKSAYYAAYAGTETLNGLNLHRALVNYRMGKVTLGGLMQRSEKSDGSADGNGFAFNVSYLMGAWLAKAQFATDNSKIRHSEDTKQITLGLDYLFDSQAKAYLLLSNLELETTDDSTVGVGLQYKF